MEPKVRLESSRVNKLSELDSFELTREFQIFDSFESTREFSFRFLTRSSPLASLVSDFSKYSQISILHCCPSIFNVKFRLHFIAFCMFQVILRLFLEKIGENSQNIYPNLNFSLEKILIYT